MPKGSWLRVEPAGLAAPEATPRLEFLPMAAQFCFTSILYTKIFVWFGFTFAFGCRWPICWTLWNKMASAFPLDELEEWLAFFYMFFYQYGAHTNHKMEHQFWQNCELCESEWRGVVNVNKHATEWMCNPVTQRQDRAATLKGKARSNPFAMLMAVLWHLKLSFWKPQGIVLEHVR